MRRYRLIGNATMLEDDAGEWCRFEQINNRSKVMSLIGMETFTMESGEIFKRPTDQLSVDDRVGIIGANNTVEIAGEVEAISILGGEVIIMVYVGGCASIPRRLREIAIPL